MLPHTAARAAFPLGGLGTGNVSLGARGELRDWELENLPDKGRDNPYSFFAIHVADSLGGRHSRILEAPLTGPHDSERGYEADRLAGLPRLSAATMHGAYPIVEIDFSDESLPVEVSLRAFTPLIPLDPEESGIPAAVLRYRVRNPGRQPVRVTVAGSVSHTAGRDRRTGELRARQTARWREDAGIRGIDFGIALPEDDLGYGTLALTTSDPSVTAKPQWVTSFWPDGPRLFWNDFSADGLLEPEPSVTTERGVLALHTDRTGGRTDLSEDELLELLPLRRTGSLGIVHDLAPGAAADFEFVLSWSFPLRPGRWEGHIMQPDAERPPVRNAYAARWRDAWDAAAHLHRNLPALEATTSAFVDALYGGGLDPVIAESVGANIAALRSTTCFVLDTPTPLLGGGPVFAAWEGSFDHAGSCEGTCTHVWSYAQTCAWLFPSLERSARRVEFLLETDEDGAQRFRTNRIFGGEPWHMAPAVDGLLGTFLRLHREWRFCGDDEFLRELWPAARRSLDWALRTWDRDGDGLLDGEMHNTYDIEFHGIEPLANGMLIAALRAGVRMARHLDDEAIARRWSVAADRAAVRMSELLWNGEYFVQRIDDIDQDRYQFGEGVLSDQLLGQFHAYLNGLGELLPGEQIRGALGAILEHNFRPDLWGHESTQRTYALNHEGGILLASWPRGGRPRIPFVYSDEVWTGIEHQVAASLAFAGRPEDAVLIERTLRARYEGTTRSPWDEIECGHHYARSLSSWALLLAFSGIQWDAPTTTLNVDPISDGAYLFTTDRAWGTVRVVGDELTLDLTAGHLALSEIRWRGAVVGQSISVEPGSPVRIRWDDEGAGVNG
ncbi:non-lysosomal glucosylceramidase [Microbacterium insulae]